MAGIVGLTEMARDGRDGRNDRDGGDGRRQHPSVKRTKLDLPATFERLTPTAQDFAQKNQRWWTLARPGSAYNTTDKRKHRAADSRPRMAIIVAQEPE